jgi:hypothetical protein
MQKPEIISWEDTNLALSEYCTVVVIPRVDNGKDDLTVVMAIANRNLQIRAFALCCLVNVFSHLHGHLSFLRLFNV